MRRVSFCQAACVAITAMLLSTGDARAARPVARWDVIPDQFFDGVFEAGVCAFHVDGVSVEFSANGKALATIQNPTLNPRTQVWEFFVPLRAADFPDGPVEIKARAVSQGTVAEAYDLPPLLLYANSRGTLTVKDDIWVDAVKGDDANAGTKASPLQTLAAAVKKTSSGGTVNLMPGVYSSAALGGGSSRKFWTTIQAAPGVPRDQVEVSPGRPGTDRLRWKGLTLFCDFEGKYTTILSGENGKHRVWLDDCVAYNKKGRWAGNSNLFGNRYTSYITGGVTREMNNGPDGEIIRNHTLENIASDAWTGGGKLVVNSTCIGIDPGKTGAHPDFHQSHAKEPGWVEDVILYNVRGYDCRSQGLFGVRLRNAAFVNVEFQKADTVMLSQYSGPMENVLFLHLTIVGQSWLWREGYSPKDVVMLNSVLVKMSGHSTDGSEGLLVDHNHFTNDGKGAGSNISEGDPLFRLETPHDFRLKPNSPAVGNGKHLQCVPADIDGKAHPKDRRNRGAHAE